MLKLYRFPGATCAAKVVFALSEKGQAFDDIVLDRADLSTDWYLKLNPNGVVPTIEHDGEVITESTVILNYIDDIYEGTPLRPSDPLARARMNYWMKTMDDMLTHLGAVTYSIALRQGYLALPPARLDAHLNAIPDPTRRADRRELIELGLDSPKVQFAVSELLALQKRADADLANADYLCGKFSIADISLAAFTWRLEPLGLLELEANPNLHDWWARIQLRPAFSGVSSSAPVALTEGLRQAAALQADRISQMRQTAQSGT